MAKNLNKMLIFPTTEFKVQSPFLYLQSAGSTGADGSTYGAHVRWLLLRNLDTHLPKGDYAATNVNFNKPADYLKLMRSKYIKRFPTVVDFFATPDVADDTSAVWIYKTTNTNTVVYIHFRDTAKYAAVRAAVNPLVDSLEFVKQYCPALIEAEVKDKLCFAAEFNVVRNAATVMRTEALSVETNVPLSPVFVSCRRKFTDCNWCSQVRSARESKSHESNTSITKTTLEGHSCCNGPNLIENGGFESLPSAGFGFATDYSLLPGSNPGTVNFASDASSIEPVWQGKPHTGNTFLAIAGSTKAGSVAVRFNLKVEAQTDYCFFGWLSIIGKADSAIALQFRLTSEDGTTQSFLQTTPMAMLEWEQFCFSWNSGVSRVVTIEILSDSIQPVGNSFGLDDLWFCKRKKGDECQARILSENIRSVRFEVNGGYPRRLEFETYQDYMTGALWNALDDLALTKVDATAFTRLEPLPLSVDGHWLKFKEHSLLNVANYRDRWRRAKGLKEGVEKYIALSNTDPQALETLQGDSQPQDGSIEVSWLDALLMVSLDFHVARMLGLGYLDRDIADDADEFIYLGVYDTEGALDDTNVARPVRHYYMGVPTSPLDYRLPGVPQLKPATYGLTVNNGAQHQTQLTDQHGYTPDGLARYVSLFVEPEADDPSPSDFFVPPFEFCAIEKTSSVFYGVEYRKQGEISWRNPEIAHDAVYKDLDTPPQFETLPLPNNHNSEISILRHEELENGVHEYAGYGINWFSRASAVGNIIATDATLIRKAQSLLPPSNFAVQLIQEETPLMLTTLAEQNTLHALTNLDKTLVRVTFDYFYTHDINYAFANAVELFFRSERPRNVAGAVKTVTDQPADNRYAIIRTMDYMINSQGKSVVPALDPSLYSNFVGGMLSFHNSKDSYVVTNIAPSLELGEGPIFTVRKGDKGIAKDPDGSGTFLTVQEYTEPALALSNGQTMFMAIENMADANSWGTPNPLAKIVNIGDSAWTPHSETYVQDGDSITVQLRGIVALGTLTHTPTNAAAGVYKIAFATYQLPHHAQYADVDPVEWHKGAVRVATVGDPNGPKKVLEVLLVENLGANLPLVLYVLDNAYDPGIPDGQAISNTPVIVNYYPGYKVYLHADATHNLAAAAILPATGEGNRKTWLGARSCDTTEHFYSAVGIPAPIVALEFIEPLPPRQPTGGEFATRPDFYYKSSYTFRLDFQHKPFALVFYRANDEAILRSIYKDPTYAAVRQQLELLGDGDLYRSDRWKDLLSFDYIYDDPSKPYYDATHSNANGAFRKFPATNGYAFPNPDKVGGGLAPWDIIGDLRDAIWGAFTALTEQPLIYDFIKDKTYVPVSKPQNIRDSQGRLLDPADPAFDLAPMAKRTTDKDKGFEIQFTDFTLDGTSANIFFYCGREIGNRGRMGDPGPIAGPIQLINTRPPVAPVVKKMYLQERDLLTNPKPSVIFEIDAYPSVQKVESILVYRATNAADSLTVRTMEKVKTVDLTNPNQLGQQTFKFADDFALGRVPYGDTLFYRIVALRKVQNPNGGTDWAPSQPSKPLLTTVIDNINPDPPEINFLPQPVSGSPAVLPGVVLSWLTPVYNGTYYLDKMNNGGSWVTIFQIKTNNNVVVNLGATKLGTDTLSKASVTNGRTIYHRFRVRVENSSGLFNLADKILTI